MARVLAQTARVLALARARVQAQGQGQVKSVAAAPAAAAAPATEALFFQARQTLVQQIMAQLHPSRPK